MWFKKKAEKTFGGEDVFLIVGLGNPGNQYDNTKHNVGFDVIDKLAEKHNIKINKIKYKAVYGEGRIGNKKVVLLKPQTFMNLSGESVSAARTWYKVPDERILLVFDDVDIPMGETRVKRNGSAGSHNGMKSVIYQLGTDRFPRVKIGIGPKPQGWDLADYVLSRFSPEDRKEKIDPSEANGVLAIEEIVTGSIENAMSKYNGTVSTKPATK